MANVEGFRDIWGRVLDDEFLPNAGGVRSILSGGTVVREGMDLTEDLADEARVVQLEMEELLVVCYGCDECIRLELRDKACQHAGLSEKISTCTSCKTALASSSGFPGSRNRGRATVKSTPFFP